MRTSIGARANLELIEENYRRWQRNPQSVDSGWSAFFEGFELGNLPQRDGATAAAAREAALQTRVDGLIYAYCSLGHTIARVDPLAETRPQNPLLSLREFGFSESDLDLRVSSKFFLDNQSMTLREMVSGLERIYADSIGSEFMHIQDPRVRDWIRKRLETRPHKHSTPAAVQVALLRALLEAESFEIFLHTRYVGQKRFSLQGSESLMVILDTILHKCPEGGVEEICMGMAHRGRLNILANFLRKSLKVIFTEFSENYVPELAAGDGDVKYHLGYHSVRKLASRAEIEIRLSSNPSHLEAVDPVVEGQARARQRLRGDTEHRRKVLPLLVHGDAAFIGQGIVAETLNLSQLPGYSTGGTIHIVVNNQIGFTTLPKDARSSTYSIEKRKASEKARFRESTAIFQPEYSSESEPTAISQKTLKTIVDGLTRVPEGFEIQPKIKRIVLDHQRKVFEEGGPYEWHFAEALAFGSLLLEGIPIRLSGQDSSRGTFSTRHSVLYDAKTGKPYVPLMHLAQKQARICIYNSPLSEGAVLGFDYGYSLDYPKMLCLWEAQFGDFSNGAQTIIDQFIVSAESKWQRPSGIVLLLPHGYEGQGPEHSSARLERFLQACAEDNMQVCNLTTAAQYFHVLRRQMKRDFIKPLIIATPKSLLRASFASSPAEEFIHGRFEEILGSPEATPADRVKRIIFCSGKVYYDLLNYRTQRKIDDAAIIRVEQLYPLAEKKLREMLKPFSKNAKLVWCQEEPENMGAWTFIESRLRTILCSEIAYAGREASASPAVGALARHKREQARLVADAFAV